MFRFTIRDVLWLIVVAGMGVGWWIDRRFVVAERDMHRERAREKDVVLYRVRSTLHHYRFGEIDLDFKEIENGINEAVLK